MNNKDEDILKVINNEKSELNETYEQSHKNIKLVERSTKQTKLAIFIGFIIAIILLIFEYLNSIGTGKCGNPFFRAIETLCAILILVDIFSIIVCIIKIIIMKQKKLNKEKMKIYSIVLEILCLLPIVLFLIGRICAEKQMCVEPIYRLSDIQIQTYNSEFECYIGNKIGSKVRELIQVVNSHNRAYQDDESLIISINSRAYVSARIIKPNKIYRVLANYDKSGFLNEITIEEYNSEEDIYTEVVFDNVEVTNNTLNQ